MQTYARMVNGVVAEVVTTTADIATLYHPAAGFVSTGAAAGVAAGWTYDGATFAPPTLTVSQALADLASHRYGVEVAGVFFKPSASPMPVLFATDRAGQSQIAKASALAMAGKWPMPSALWKLAPGVYVAMTAADIEGLSEQVAAYVQGCFAHEAALAAAIVQVPATVMTAGWPSNA